MSQGVLVRGQPEQTEEEDGQNQKADAEYVIRRGFIEADLIEALRYNEAFIKRAA